MKPIEQNLTQYAAYHRDRRNIATHFVGVPMIVFAIILALATVTIPLGPVVLTLAAIVSIALCLYYLRLDRCWGSPWRRCCCDVRRGERDDPSHERGRGTAWALAIFGAGGGSSSSATSTRA